MDIVCLFQVICYCVFDMCVDLLKVFDDFVDFGIECVLIFGQVVFVLVGVVLLVQFVEWVGEDIVVLLGVGIILYNVVDFVNQIGVWEIYVIVWRWYESLMLFCCVEFFMGVDEVLEYVWNVVDLEEVEVFVCVVC